MTLARDAFRGVQGEAAYGASAVITTTTDVTVLAAAGAGYKYLIRRMMVINITTAEKAVIEIHDSADAILGYMEARDPAVNPCHDTGWLEIPIETAANVAVEANALTTTGDTYVMIWADKVKI